MIDSRVSCKEIFARQVIKFDLYGCTSVLKRFLRERNISLHLFDYIDTYFSRRYSGVLVNKCDLMLCFVDLACSFF